VSFRCTDSIYHPGRSYLNHYSIIAMPDFVISREVGVTKTGAKVQKYELVLSYASASLANTS
jgi:hypothetical protein